MDEEKNSSLLASPTPDKTKFIGAVTSTPAPPRNIEVVEVKDDSEDDENDESGEGEEESGEEEEGSDDDEDGEGEEEEGGDDDDDDNGKCFELLCRTRHYILVRFFFIIYVC